MVKDEFWSVEAGVGLGPLTLGSELEEVLQTLQEHQLEPDRAGLDGSGKMAIEKRGIQLCFSKQSPRVLIRIDVSNPQVRFGSLAVIGKRVHEIIGIFKVSRKETVWCGIDSPGGDADQADTADRANQSRELLAKGTIWLPRIGLGFTLSDGLIATVHLCDPADAPTSGVGPWTKEQQLLSEVREIPTTSDPQVGPRRRAIGLGWTHIALFISLGGLFWWASQVQQQWNMAKEVTAVVVDLSPPPPHPLPNEITVRFSDAQGAERTHTLGFAQFFATPKMGEEVSVHYLPESPDHVLGPVAARDIGFQTVFPYGIGLLAAYSVLQLILYGKSPIRVRRKYS